MSKRSRLIGASLVVTLGLGIGYTAVGADNNLAHRAPDGQNSPVESRDISVVKALVPTPEQLKNQLEQNLSETKSRGKSWIINKAQNEEVEEVIATLTLNEKVPLQAAFDFAIANNLEIEQWSTVYDIGNHTYTGGYEVGSEETLKEAQERFYRQFEGFLTEGIEDLSRTMEAYPEGTEQHEAAKKKYTSFKQFQSTYVKGETPLVYGIRVSSAPDKIRELLSQQKIHAVGQPGKGRAIYKEIPANWLQGVDKINEKIN